MMGGVWFDLEMKHISVTHIQLQYANKIVIIPVRKKRKGLDVYIVHVCKLSGGYIIYAKQCALHCFSGEKCNNWLKL